MEQAASSPRNTAGQRNISRGALTERDDLLLRAIYELQFVTTEQMTRLYFSPGSLTHVRVVLKQLTDGGYLHRLRMPSDQDGVKPWVYTLGRLGIRYLNAAGYREFARYRPSEQKAHSYLFLAHTLGIGDVVIAAKLLSERVPDYVLADFRHDRMLKRTPVEVSTPEDGKIGIVPDLWLDWHIGGTSRASIALEYDRATEEQRQWRRKIRGLIAFANGPYQEAYGSESLTIAIGTTGGVQRAEVIRGWLEQELKHAGREQDGEIFVVSALPSGELDPVEFFTHPRWIQPFQTQAVPLLGV